MKIFYLLPLSLMMLTGCKYGSYREANDSCYEWSNKVSEATITKYDWDNPSRVGIRFCKKEEETNQVIGLERKNIKPINYKQSDWDKIENPMKLQVKKRFKY